MARKSNIQRIEDIKGNLQTVMKALEGEQIESKGILAVMISETVAEVREASFSYEVKFTHKDNTLHWKHFEARGKKYKALLISDLQEIHQELGKRNTNVNRVPKMLNKILQTNLYKSYTESLIGKWKSLSHHYKPEVISVK
ncbi:hypothetical protein [Rossellomorea aquimaris]|uniref:hypothetical protein n=1 Tax=Rossellomorea aquimaris TaxID=189382 RepID=UPI0011E990C7|nr:hypothetical protein [Rossellomorea aquimaris]TYS87505.1 hypothetical protein FZC88_16045 [Rossellomorea aquimaris]